MDRALSFRCLTFCLPGPSVPGTGPTELDAQTELLKVIVYAPTFQLSSSPLCQLSSLLTAAPRQLLVCAVDRAQLSQSRSCGQAASCGRHSIHAMAFATDLWSKPNSGNACAALRWSNLYHICIQTSPTFDIEIKI